MQEICARTESIKERLLHLQRMWSASRGSSALNQEYCPRREKEEESHLIIPSFGTDRSTSSAPDSHEEVERMEDYVSSTSAIPLHSFESIDARVLEELIKADADGNQLLDAKEIVRALEACMMSAGTSTSRSGTKKGQAPDSHEEVVEEGSCASAIPLQAFESRDARVLEELIKADADGNQLLDAKEIVRALEACMMSAGTSTSKGKAVDPRASLIDSTSRALSRETIRALEACMKGARWPIDLNVRVVVHCQSRGSDPLIPFHRPPISVSTFTIPTKRRQRGDPTGSTSAALLGCHLLVHLKQRSHARRKQQRTRPRPRKRPSPGQQSRPRSHVSLARVVLLVQ